MKVKPVPTTQLSEIYRKAFQLVRCGSCWIDQHGKIGEANEQFARDHGLDHPVRPSLSIFEINPRLNFLEWKNHWRRLCETGRFELITEHMFRSDRLFPVKVSAHLIDHGDRPLALAFVEDLAESAKAKEAAAPRQSDAPSSELGLAQFTVDHAAELIFWINRAGIFRDVNNTACDKLGYAREELVGMQSTEIVRGLDDEDRAQIWRQLEEKKQVALESTLLTREGFAIPVFSSINYLTYKGEELACIFSRDWTLKKERDKQLELTRLTMDSAVDMIFWLDDQSRLVYINQAASELLSAPPEEAAAMTWAALDVHYPTEPQARRAYWETPDAGLETLLRRPDGTQLPVDITFRSVSFEEENFICLLVRDVSVRNRREKELRAALDKVSELSKQLEEENNLLKAEINLEYNFNNIISTSPRYKQVLKQVEQVAGTDATVLIVGETGTGKELLARAIHVLSNREHRSLVKINCAALPPSLIESELFGHEKGAFTGAYDRKKGRFELADGGTIFLDEIGELPLELQTKLLRILQEGEFERVGGTTTLTADVRVIAATNRNLEEMVSQGEFREDLYYRLNVFPIRNLPLRERREDIPLLVRHFTQKYSEKSGKKIEQIPENALRKLQQYDFPGNVRELENIVERAVILADGKTLNLAASFSLSRRSNKKQGKNEAFPSFEAAQRDHILRALERTGWRVTGPRGAARLLQLNDRTLASKMRRLGIRREDYS